MDTTQNIEDTLTNTDEQILSNSGISKPPLDALTKAKRICQIIKLIPESAEEYRHLHANAWPGVLAALKRHHIIDYSIHYYPPFNLLIANFKYIGEDYEKDMTELASDEETQRWWKVTDPLQTSLQDGATGSGKEVPWWTDLEEIFRFDGN